MPSTSRTIRVDSVEVVHGSDLNRYWSEDMQVITAMVPMKFICRVPEDDPSVIDWSQAIGQEVEVDVTQSSGYNWINLK